MLRISATPVAVSLRVRATTPLVLGAMVLVEVVVGLVITQLVQSPPDPPARVVQYGTPPCTARTWPPEPIGRADSVLVFDAYSISPVW